MSLSSLQDVLFDPRVTLAEQDRAVWAYLKARAYPLSLEDHKAWNLDVDVWPGTQLVSNPRNVFALIESEWDSHRLSIDANQGNLSSSLILSSNEARIGMTGKFGVKGSISDLGKAVVMAFVEARDKALDLESRVAAVAGLEPADISTWPIENLSDTQFAPVDHDNRLMGLIGSTRSYVEKNIDLNHKGPYGLMLCRERYERIMAEQSLVWMVGSPKEVARNEFRFGPSLDAYDLVDYMEVGDLLVGKDQHGTLTSSTP